MILIMYRDLIKTKLDLKGIYLIWGVYFLFIQNFGWIYNFKFLTFFFIPLLIITILLIIKNCFSFHNSTYRTLPRLSKIIYIIVFLLIIHVIKISLIYPDYSWDGLAYHLSASVEWAKKGKIDLVNISIYSSTYPGLSELIQSLWFRSTNLYGPPHNLSQLIAILIIGISVVGISRNLGFNPQLQFISLIYSLSIPNVILQATTAYNDLFFSSLIIAGTYFVLAYTKDKLQKNNIDLYCIGVSAGLIASTKYTGVYFGVALFGLLILANFRDIKKYLKQVIVSITLGLMICMPWYLKNWVNFKNPFHPLSLELFNQTIFKGSLGTPDRAFFDYFSSKVGIENSAFGVIKSWFWWPINHPVYDTRVGGSGLSWLVIFIATCLIFVVKLYDSNFRFKLVGSREFLTIGFIFVSVFTVPAGWWPRYVLFFPILFGVISIGWILKEYLILNKIILFSILLTVIESLFYLTFYAGTSIQNIKIAENNSFFTKPFHATIQTVSKLKRQNVYTFVSPQLLPLASEQPSIIYIHNPGQQYFPLYGIDFQHEVYYYPDLEFVNYLSTNKLNNFKVEQLDTKMRYDNKSSIFVTSEIEKFELLLKYNSSCVDLTLQMNRTFITRCN
jgi:hypothetical protein